jgi:plastocyanin
LTITTILSLEKMMRSSMLQIIGIAALAACGGGGGGGTAPGGNGGGGGGGTLVHAQRVTATTAITFNPSAISIPAGDTIYYTFESVKHNVIFDTAGNPGDVPDTFSQTVKRAFPTAGTFNYHCSIHPSMTGTVTVTQ